MTSKKKSPISNTMSIDISAGAMQVAALGVSVTANNIANVNTDGFHASSARYMTGPRDQGVILGEVRNSADSRFARPVWDGESATIQKSNTDIAIEFVNLISDQRMFEANAVAVTVWNDMTGVVIDIVT